MDATVEKEKIDQVIDAGGMTAYAKMAKMVYETETALRVSVVSFFVTVTLFTPLIVFFLWQMVGNIQGGSYWWATAQALAVIVLGWDISLKWKRYVIIKDCIANIKAAVLKNMGEGAYERLISFYTSMANLNKAIEKITRALNKMEKK